MVRKSNKSTKYTHLIERCSSFLRTLSQWRLEVCTGYTLSEAYWRLRNGKGLVSLYDQESLDQWSDLITEVRRYAGPPYYINPGFHNTVKDEKDKLLEGMERYRDFLAEGKKPEYLGQGENIRLYAEVIQEFFLKSNIDPTTMDLPMTQEKKEGAGQKETKPYPQLVSEQLEFLQLLDWIAVDRRFGMLLPVFEEWRGGMQEELDQAEQEMNRVEQDRALSEEERKEKLFKMKSRIFDLEFKCDTWSGFYEYLSLKHIENQLRPFKNDKVWQIRTDIDNRSSINADISARLYCIWDVGSNTCSETRQLMEKNRKILHNFREWKAAMLQQKKEGKEKYGRTPKYEQEEIAGKVCEAISSIKVPSPILPEDSI